MTQQADRVPVNALVEGAVRAAPFGEPVPRHNPMVEGAVPQSYFHVPPLPMAEVEPPPTRDAKGRFLPSRPKE